MNIRSRQSIQCRPARISIFLSIASPRWLQSYVLHPLTVFVIFVLDPPPILFGSAAKPFLTTKP